MTWEDFKKWFGGRNSDIDYAALKGTSGHNWITNFGQDLANWIDGSNAAATQYGYQSQLQEDQQAFNSAEAEKDRQFQAEQEATRYQRAAADLRAAGLNPWLAVTGMSGSAASGSAGTSSAGSVSQQPSGANTLSSLASTAVSAALIAKIVAKMMA